MIDGVIYNKKAEKKIFYPPEKTTKSFAIPNSTIENEIIFSGAMQEIVISENVTTVYASFYKCDSLKTVTFINESNDCPTTNKINIYVPDNKIEEYKIVSGRWTDINFEVIPLNRVLLI